MYKTMCETDEKQWLCLGWGWGGASHSASSLLRVETWVPPGNPKALRSIV